MRLLKTVSILVAALAVVSTAIIMPVTHAQAYEVVRFGYDNEMTRVAPDKSYVPVSPLWLKEAGRSTSQPLILKGEHFGVENPVIVVLANNTLLGIESTAPGSAFTTNPKILFSYPMPGPGTEAGGSYITWGNGVLIVGSVDGKLYMFKYDKTSKQLVKSIERDLGGSRLVSAPLVTQYKGNAVVVCANGDGGEVVVVTNFDKPTPDYFKFSFGKGTRVSGSPAPIGNVGFIAGSDGDGKVRGYYFEHSCNERKQSLKKRIPHGRI